MPYSIPRAIMYALASAGAASASGVSLSEFTPRIDNLPSQCQSVYTTIIQGCVPGDFRGQGPNGRCSASCVSGLVTITQSIITACGNVDVDKKSIIGVFLQGSGIPSLCPGIEVTTLGSSSSTAAAPPASSTQAPPPPPQSSSQQQSTTTATSAASSSTGGIIFDSTVPTEAPTGFATSVSDSPALATNTAQPPANSATSAARASSTAGSQKSNSDSGGGSPFDVVATGSSPRLPRLGGIAIGAMLATAVFFSTML